MLGDTTWCVGKMSAETSAASFGYKNVVLQDNWWHVGSTVFALSCIVHTRQRYSALKLKGYDVEAMWPEIKPSINS